MAVVDVDPDDLRRFTGHDEKADEELREDLFELGLEFEGETDEGHMQLEFEADRLDRLSVEGIARSLRYQYGDDRGVYVPRTNDADWTIEVDPSTPDERPYVTGAVIRGLDLDEAGLESLIQLQEKLHATMGRGRAKGAIGIHDLTMLKGRSLADAADSSITYRGIEPDEDGFVPLDSHAELTPAEVLTDHPTGETYADLIAEYDRYPAIYDDLGLFSFPPVINGRRTEVNTESRELFVELTGTDQWTIDRMCAIVCYALDARGATVERVTVEYPDRTLDRPDFALSERTVSHGRIERSLGISLDEHEVVDLLERSGLDAEASDGGDDGEGDESRVYDVSIPPYRVDVLHPVDVIDDIGRAYGFNELEPEYPDVSTVGGRHERSRRERAIREALVGLGFEDLLDFHLIGERENFELENNTHRRYPQDLAEVGLAARVDPGQNTNVAEERHVAGVLARIDASYEDAKGRVSALARAFDAELTTSATDHPSFVDGRAASVVLDGECAGIIGELHPEVLVEHGLEVPVAAFEFRGDALR
ncbi:phenylalanine--tRNA ligase subunit beta [Halobacteriales archaeon QS_7_68_65]|nr:MAG: phenylalanine--tRNA ligase subunit beta [Halobacteriales archaeon QS_7_68_65]